MVDHLSNLIVAKSAATLRPLEISHDDEVRTLLESITSDDLLSCTQLDSGKNTCTISLRANNEKMLRLFRILSTPEQLAMVCNKLDLLVTTKDPVKKENEQYDGLLLDQLFTVIKYSYLNMLNTPKKPKLYSILTRFGLFGKLSSESFYRLHDLAKLCLVHSDQ
jgi:hypothetical protein